MSVCVWMNEREIMIKIERKEYFFLNYQMFQTKKLPLFFLVLYTQRGEITKKRRKERKKRK